MNLYEWQKECLNRWYENRTRGIVNVFTGAGKTILALAAVSELRASHPAQLHVRIVVPTTALAKQWKKELISYFPEMEFSRNSIGFYYGRIKNNTDRDITIYVINSARETLSAHILQDMRNGIHAFLICDECHRYTGEVNRHIFNFILSEDFDSDLYHCLGLSATPQNENYETVLVPALGQEIYHYDIDKAGTDQRISPFVLIHTAISLTGDEAAEYGEITEHLRILYSRLLKAYPHLKYADSQEFYQFIFRSAREEEEGICASFANLLLKRRDLIYRAENRKKCVLSILEHITDNEKVILFAERIEQADEIYRELLPVYGNRVTHYHSEMPSALRSHNLSMFRIGEASILISCKALDEGLDVPDASIGIVMSSTSVSRQRIQRLGRILRKNPDKSIAKLYYIYTQGTTEDRIYLPDLQESADEYHVFYDGTDNSFFSDQYSFYASAMYRNLSYTLSQKEREEIGLCLEEGILRADWYLPLDKLNQKISNALSQHEKNYWIVMKRIARQRNNHS